MSNIKSYRTCFVPSCSNTTKTTPQKIFLNVPIDAKRRNKWFQAVRRPNPKTRSNYFCCEDHFDLKVDMDNYIYYTTMGGRAKMKVDVLPHKFISQSDHKSQGNTTVKPAAENRRKKKAPTSCEEQKLWSNKLQQLIANIKKYPCLWEVPSYNSKLNLQLREAAWIDIVKSCDLTSVKQAKTLWKNLRDRYRKVMNSMNKKSTDITEFFPTKWKYEDQMHFLLPIMKIRPKHTIEEEINKENEDDQESDCSEMSTDISEITPEYIIDTHIPPREIKIEHDENCSVDSDIKLKFLESNFDLENQQNHPAMEKFFMSMCEATWELPTYLQIRIQKQIFNLVTEAREEYLSQALSDVKREKSEFSNNNVSDICNPILGAHSSLNKLKNSNLETESSRAHSSLHQVHESSSLASNTSLNTQNTIKTESNENSFVNSIKLEPFDDTY